MSLVRLHVLVLAVVASLAIGCGASQRPQMKVIGVEQSETAYDGRQIKLFVEVVNYARRPMRLQRLQYTFGPQGSRETSARGEVKLSRTIDAGSAVVVEVPIIVDPQLLNAGGLELRGQLITEQDQIVRSFPVKAEADLAAPAEDSPADASPAE
jgi:hypothetical protein